MLYEVITCELINSVELSGWVLPAENIIAAEIAATKIPPR